MLTNLAVEGAVVTDEGWALVDFKGSIANEHGILEAWIVEETSYPCEWYGISCDKNFHIRAINLCNNGLLGTISGTKSLSSSSI